MFALQNRKGEWVFMRDGERFTYSTRELALIGARVLRKQHGNLKVVTA